MKKKANKIVIKKAKGIAFPLPLWTIRTNSGAGMVLLGVELNFWGTSQIPDPCTFTLRGIEYGLLVVGNWLFKDPYTLWCLINGGSK